MRHFIILLTLVLAAYLASSSPIDHKSKLVNRPSVGEIFGGRSKRSNQHAEGWKPREGTIKYPPTKINKPPLEFNLRKGEYMCGGKVCQLKPGDPTCPFCQRPI